MKKWVTFVLLGNLLLFFSGCQKSKNETVETKAIEETTNVDEFVNQFSSTSGEYMVKNEVFLTPDFECELTDSKVTQQNEKTYLTLFFNYKNKTDKFPVASEIFHYYLSVKQVVAEEDILLPISKTDLKEIDSQKIKNSHEIQVKDSLEDMAVTFEAIDDKENVQLDFLDEDKAVIVSKYYLLQW